MPASTSTLIPCVFFFQRYADHRDLHSFPTRRSSDLGKTGALVALANAGLKLRVLAYDKAANFQPLLNYTKPEVRGFVVGDRKSTRLNSSHVEISYAVFCLKKKKKYE